MNCPKKDFIPKTLADLNIDTLSNTSGGSDGYNNNNGGRFTNITKSQANLYASQQNLSSNSSKLSSSASATTIANNFNRTKMYGSQHSLSSKSYETTKTVNNNNNNYVSPVDVWMNAWDTDDSVQNNQSRNSHRTAPVQTTRAQKSSNSNVNLYNNNNLNRQNNNYLTSSNSSRLNSKTPVSIANQNTSASSFYNQSRNVDLLNHDDPWQGE